MKKILVFVFGCIVGIAASDAAVRDGNTKNRTNATTTAPAQQRVATTERTGVRTVTRIPANTTTATTSASRSATTTARNAQKSTTSRATSQNVASRSATKQTVSARATTTGTTTVDLSETRTGAAYEQCKNAYFTCMDQFCELKNDDYRRCSCSNRVLELGATRTALQEAGEQLTVFNENLDTVGMTAAQATAMKTASEGENALTSDTSASKALLQAIMNSIRGEDSNVSGKFSALNSINLSFDTTNAFGTLDAGAAVAQYSGTNLYTAVYPQCRNAVRADCNDASLQRAINAYLMAIEQDCNTVQTAIENTQKQMKSAVRESSAMLDLARVENRQKHNSDDIATCINNVESAILSEQVCGANYHKCLDNGEFIDISTGAPIAGVERFYELGDLLKFADGVNAADQKLSKISSNRTFVQNFENRTKKFAQPALDKCTENADTVWSEYLDKAMLSIYYAQKSKVSEIKQGCFDFVSSCYMNADTGLTAAMKELTGDNAIILQPDKVALSTAICRDYIDSCNYMFDGNIVADYIKNRQDTDTLTACRAVAKQCFDKFGGSGYENFYYPYSGLFQTGNALDWFTLYEYSGNVDATGQPVADTRPVSECARQLLEIDSCHDIVADVFGGFDAISAAKGTTGGTNAVTVYYLSNNSGDERSRKYGILDSVQTHVANPGVDAYVLQHHTPRPTGVATEIYNQVIDNLSTQCTNLQGRFVELQFIKDALYDESNICLATFSGKTISGVNKVYDQLVSMYGIASKEDMCPRDYGLSVDVASWGACLCWENGGRRSKFGTSVKCLPAIPVQNDITDESACTSTNTTATSTTKSTKWCIQSTQNNGLSSESQVCPLGGVTRADGGCNYNGQKLKELPEGFLY